MMHRIRRISIGVAALVLVAVGCAPAPTPASTDTLDLGTLGRFSEPAVDISASITEQDSPRGPRSADLTVIARDADGNIVEIFTMHEYNVSDSVTLPGPGDFPGIFAPPHTRQFTVATSSSDPGVSTVLGDVTITELTTGAVTGAGGGPVYDVTRLRASFTGVFDAYGTVNGYFTIG